MAKATSAPEMDDKYQAEDDMRTLTRAEEIKADPKRMKAVAAIAQEKTEELESVTESLAKRGLISDKARAKMAKDEAETDTAEETEDEADD